jgi:Putative zinc-finger
MTAQIVNLASLAHQNAQDLLPWFVMGTLDEEDRSKVDEHLRSCAACRHDLQWHAQLREAHDEPAPVRDVDRAFAALRARLPAPLAQPSVTDRARSLWQRWMPERSFGGWALALQSVVIVGLASALLLGLGKPAPDEAHLFHALSRPADAATTSKLVVVFSPQASQAEMRRVLLASGARIVDGPTAADAYILAVASDRADHALQLLRAEHSVLLIHSLEAKDLN